MEPPACSRSASSRWAALLLALLLLAVACGGGAAAAAAAPASRTPAGCGRRLLQAGDTAPPAATDTSSNTVVETVEVDVVSQECVMNTNTYYRVQPDRGVVQVQAPEDSLQPTAIQCCASCHDLGSACTAFQWCGQEGGCPVPGNASASFPFQGCQLLDLRKFLATSINTGELKVAGAPFTAGSPLYFSVPKLSGYDVEIGRNFGGKFNYSCAGSVFNTSCVLIGSSARELGAACDADPNCLAFSFWPKGAPWSNGSSFATLKGGQGVQLSSDDTEINPEAAIYIKLDPLDGDGDAGTQQAGDAAVSPDDSGGSSTTTIIVAVVCSVVGVALLAAAVLGLVYVRHRRAKAAVADMRKPAGSGPGGAGLALPGSDEEGASGPDGSSGEGSPAARDARMAAANGGASTASEHSQDGDLAVMAAAAVGGAALAAPKSAPAGLSTSPPSVLVQTAGGVAAAGVGYTPFMMLSPGQLASGGSASQLAAADASRSSSDGSAAQQQHAQVPAWMQPQLELALELADAPVPPDMVVVERAAQLSSGARGELPPSLSQAATARELLEVFARMYSQRPAVDLNLVAQMLDQDADPSAVAAAERQDEELLRQVDVEATKQRATSRNGSAPASNGGIAGVAAGAAAAAAVAGAPGAAAQGPASVPGSAVREQEQSLLPGMISPDASMLPTPATEWSLQPEEVEICKRPDGSYWQLGTGAFGTCYKGLYHGRQLVAVKVLHRVEERRRGGEFEREVGLLKTLRDRNIVQFIGACLDGPTPMLVTEFLEFGDLWRALPLKNPAGQRIFAWHKRGRRVLFDVAKGLYYLHQRRIVHLDLKSANILLSRHGTAKICDIGMARVLGNKEYLSMLSGMGTFAWSAPEVLSGRRCTEKVDLYSFGVVIWEVCTGDVPVRGEMRALSAADCPQEIVGLYERCTAEVPEARPTAAELLQVLAEYL